MNPPLAKLGDVADVNWGNTSITKASYTETGYPAFSATGCDGFLPDFEHETAGVILSAIGAKCGKCFSASGKWTAIKNTITITPHKTEKADFRFLFYYLNREELWPKRGVGQPFIGLGDARKILVPFPPLAEQRRIAEVLDRAEVLRAKRRAAVGQLDFLTQSIFIDTFGDPLTNPKHFRMAKLGSLCVRVTDGTHQPPNWSTVGHPFLFVSNIVSGEITFDTEKFISDETHAELTRRCPIEVGDVLYSTVGSYGVPAIVRSERKFAFQRHIAHLKPNPSLLDSAFLAAMLASPPLKRQADRAAKGIAQKTVNLSEIREFLVFQPPIPLQREFARRVGAVEKLKTAQRASLAELDALFTSLQHRAFRGEL